MIKEVKEKKKRKTKEKNKHFVNEIVSLIFPGFSPLPSHKEQLS